MQRPHRHALIHLCLQTHLACDFADRPHWANTGKDVCLLVELIWTPNNSIGAWILSKTLTTIIATWRTWLCSDFSWNACLELDILFLNLQAVAYDYNHDAPHCHTLFSIDLCHCKAIRQTIGPDFRSQNVTAVCVSVFAIERFRFDNFDFHYRFNYLSLA
jgi:hypothetical protein